MSRKNKHIHTREHTSLYNEHQKYANKVEERKRHPQIGWCRSSLNLNKISPFMSLLIPSVKMPTNNQCGSNTLTCSPPTTWIQVTLGDPSLHRRTTSALKFSSTSTLNVAVRKFQHEENNILQLAMFEWDSSHPCASAIPRFSTLISHSLIIELRITCRAHDRHCWNESLTKKYNLKTKRSTEKCI